MAGWFPIVARTSNPLCSTSDLALQVPGQPVGFCALLLALAKSSKLRPQEHPGLRLGVFPPGLRKQGSAIAGTGVDAAERLSLSFVPVGRGSAGVLRSLLETEGGLPARLEPRSPLSAQAIMDIWELLFCYLSALFLFIYEKTHKLKGAYTSKTWDGARLTLLTLWDGFARFWHGYELYGTENLPNGPGLIIFYHGALPVDYMYFLARYFILKQRSCFVVADYFVIKCPGLKTFGAVMCLLPRKKKPCVNALKDGNLVAISPGGTREALFSDESCQLIWHKRKGFAEVALDAKVPIIPMYTQNIREGYRILGNSAIARKLYERFRFPVLPAYGGFPVKLRTYIGEPIPYDPNTTAVELTEKVSVVHKDCTPIVNSKAPANSWKPLQRFNGKTSRRKEKRIKLVFGNY
ncbi:hypothetical protein lerEdw1_012558 [Lerista edwardsae]|nr:hypothetical protein lerEdw1_012558 [Lerista edwardsae]